MYAREIDYEYVKFGRVVHQVRVAKWNSREVRAKKNTSTRVNVSR